MMIKGKKKAVQNMGSEENDLDAAQTNNKEQEDKNSKIHSTADEIPSTSKEGDELGNAKAEMGEVMEENQRLKMMLEKVKREYHSLQMTLFDVMKQEPQPKAPDLSRSTGPEEPEISLCLGRSPFEQKRENGINTVDNKDPTLTSEDLALGLNLRCLSETNLSDRASEPLPATEEVKDDKPEDSWPPSRTLKTTRSENEDLLPLNNKRARVSVRAKCDTPTMHDGCQWRKYGQKISKGNPCPRAYYRCTGAPSCPVRKQVQRCPEDLSILVTTYEGTHNHPLAVAATAMASTTAAAASILTSGSSTSEGSASSPAPTTTATTSTPSPTTANINGLTFALFDNSNIRQFNFPSASSPLPPTITLDLTANPSQFNNLLPGFSRAHKHSSPSISLDFSSSSLESTTLPTCWTSNNSRPNFSPSHFGKCSILSSVKFGKPPIPETLMTTRPSYLDQINPTLSSTSHSSQQFLTETLTKVLTADPSFQSAVAAAISSMVGSGNVANSGGDSFSPSFKWGGSGTIPTDEIVNQGDSLNRFMQDGKSFSPSYMTMISQSTMPTTTNSQAESGRPPLLQPTTTKSPPPFPFSFSRSSSSSMPNSDAKKTSFVD